MQKAAAFMCIKLSWSETSREIVYARGKMTFLKLLEECSNPCKRCAVFAFTQVPRFYLDGQPSLGRHQPSPFMLYLYKQKVMGVPLDQRGPCTNFWQDFIPEWAMPFRARVSSDSRTSQYRAWFHANGQITYPLDFRLIWSQIREIIITCTIEFQFYSRNNLSFL